MTTIPCIQSLRVLFSFLIVYSHIYYPSITPFDKRDGWEGPHGVTFFLMVSGLLAHRSLVHTICNPSIGFYKGTIRFVLARVPPMFIFTFVTHVAFYLLHAPVDSPRPFRDYFAFSTNPITAFWAISTNDSTIFHRIYHVNPVYWYLGHITLFWILSPPISYLCHKALHPSNARVLAAIGALAALDAFFYLRIPSGERGASRIGALLCRTGALLCINACSSREKCGSALQNPSPI